MFSNLFMSREDGIKDKQVGIWLTPADQALFVAIAEDDDRAAGQLGRRVLLEWMERWLKAHPERAAEIREIARLKLDDRSEDGPPPPPPKLGSGVRKRGSRQ